MSDTLNVTEWAKANGFDVEPWPKLQRYQVPVAMAMATNSTVTVTRPSVSGDDVLRAMREFREATADLGPSFLPRLKVSAVENMPAALQMLKLRGEPVTICGIDEIPEGAEFDEIVVHPDHYERLMASADGRP